MRDDEPESNEQNHIQVMLLMLLVVAIVLLKARK
jgi:hypothetical protein